MNTDYSNFTLAQLDLAYKCAEPGAKKDEIAREIDRRALAEIKQ